MDFTLIDKSGSYVQRYVRFSPQDRLRTESAAMDWFYKGISDQALVLIALHLIACIEIQYMNNFMISILQSIFSFI